MSRVDGMYSTSREKRRSKIRERKIVLYIDPTVKKGPSSSSSSLPSSLAVDSRTGSGIGVGHGGDGGNKDGSAVEESMAGDDVNGLSAVAVGDDGDEMATSSILDGDWNRYILTEEEQKKR